MLLVQLKNQTVLLLSQILKLIVYGTGYHGRWTLKRLEKLQTRAVRGIMNFSNDIPGPEVLKALARMETRRANTKAKTTYKVLIINWFNLRGSSTPLQLPHTESNTEKLEKRFSYNGANV